MKMRLECVVPNSRKKSGLSRSRSVAVLLLSVSTGKRSDFGPAGAQSDSLFHVEQERFCRKVTIPAPALVQLYQIHHTTVCEQTPFLRKCVEVRARCLRHEEARVTARTDSASRCAASRTQLHTRQNTSQIANLNLGKAATWFLARLSPARVQQRRQHL
jgi:hypothetical protein